MLTLVAIVSAAVGALPSALSSDAFGAILGACITIDGAAGCLYLCRPIR